ncbi:helicase SRCAP-like [Panicum hallii]|uniref:helicase SRCAP-like n=1 Tax=Panicum hallii TaxID=206008 RepID=UPI000DF4D1B7|nr:helicase SRCAP-like [Panicum hallii]
MIESAVDTSLVILTPIDGVPPAGESTDTAEDDASPTASPAEDDASLSASPAASVVPAPAAVECTSLVSPTIDEVSPAGATSTALDDDAVPSVPTAMLGPPELCPVPATVECAPLVPLFTIDGAPPVCANRLLCDDTSSPPATTASEVLAAVSDVAPIPVGDVEATVPSSGTPMGDLLAATTPLPAATTTTPVHPLVAPELCRRILPDNLIVYTRTPRRRDETPSATTEFLNKVVKLVEAIVPAPAIQKRRKKTAGPEARAD